MNRLTDVLLLVRRLLPRAFRDGIDRRLIEALPSRDYLQATLLPAIGAAGCKRMLFVGARSYNASFYRACRAQDLEVWSIDIDPAAAPHGAPDGHLVGDICDVEQLANGLRFDVIVLNGVIGFGLNTPAAAVEALAAMSKIADPSAVLVVGWNPGRTDGDAEITALRRRLAPSLLDGAQMNCAFPRHGIQGYPHHYEMFRFLEHPVPAWAPTPERAATGAGAMPPVTGGIFPLFQLLCFSLA